MTKSRRPRARTHRTGRHVLMLMQWYSHIYHRGIARYARDAGWSLDASTAHMPCAPKLSAVDGVIGNLFARDPVVDAVLAASLPMVNLSLGPGNVSLPCVLQNNIGVGTAVAAHFIGRGFRHFAYCGDAAGSAATRDRLRGFRRELQRHGFTCGLTAILDSAAGAAGGDAYFDALGRRLREMPKPVALMSANDDFAVSVLQVCDHMRLRVPDDVAIIGCDNDAVVCEFARVPLSSADCCLERQAYEAAALLDRLMNGEAPPRGPIRIPHAGIVERQSSNLLAVSHPELASAIRAIQAHYGNPLLSVEQLAQDVGMTRRGLDMACATHLGRTISRELQRVRLEKALQLLGQSTLRIAEIATRCGYGRPEHFRNSILRACGMTPRRYRQRTLANRGPSTAPAPSAAARPLTESSRSRPGW